jgi:hypothetical protein
MAPSSVSKSQLPWSTWPWWVVVGQIQDYVAPSLGGISIFLKQGMGVFIGEDVTGSKLANADAGDDYTSGFCGQLQLPCQEVIHQGGA